MHFEQEGIGMTGYGMGWSVPSVGELHEKEEKENPNRAIPRLRHELSVVKRENSRMSNIIGSVKYVAFGVRNRSSGVKELKELARNVEWRSWSRPGYEPDVTECKYSMPRKLVAGLKEDIASAESRGEGLRDTMDKIGDYCARLLGCSLGDDDRLLELSWDMEDFAREMGG